MTGANWIDRAIGWVAPAAGLRRMRYRQALQVAMAYEGASVGRRTENWMSAGGSANADIGQGLVTLRQRSRDLVQNNPHAARVLRVISTDAVGTGIVPRAASDDPRLNDTVDKLWGKWAKRCNADNDTPFYAQQAMLIRALLESGESLFRFRPRRASDGLPVALQLQMLESDQLDLAKTADAQTGYIIHGVQFNLRGQREGYWLFPVHPGEVAGFLRKGWTSKFVPASEVMHCYEPLRPGQVRGVPWFAPVVLKFRDLAEYDEAELVRKKIESCLAAFVTQPEGEDGPGIGSRGTESSTGARTESFRPGMVEYLKQGEDVKIGAPAGTSTFSDYWVQQLHTVAVGVNVMYEQLSGDLSRVNYSSFRGGMMVYRPFIEMLRWNLIVPMLCDPTWQRFTQTAWTEGLIPQPDIPVEWTPPKFQSVDPEKDARATLIDLRSGLTDFPEAVSERGFEPVKRLATIEEWNKRFDAAGVVLDCDPRKTDATGKAKVEPADSTDSTDAADSQDQTTVEENALANQHRAIQEKLSAIESKQQELISAVDHIAFEGRATPRELVLKMDAELGQAMRPAAPAEPAERPASIVNVDVKNLMRSPHRIHKVKRDEAGNVIEVETMDQQPIAG